MAILASVTDDKILLFIFVKHSTQIMERNIETLHQKCSSNNNPISVPNQLQKSKLWTAILFNFINNYY